jgi:hypothetical protein
MAGYPRTPMPDVALVTRHFSTEKLEDVTGELRKELSRVNLAGRVKPGQRIAITAGSRGLDNYALVTKIIGDELKKLDVKPFIVPAMGSHGGATAEGQLELIAEYGITEEAMGMPILSSMDAVPIGKTPLGATVYMDRNAYEADGVIAVNRVKNHTSFRAPIESGLCKILSVGLGKRLGAEAIHDYGMAANIPPAASVAIGTGKIVLGVALVENAYHKTVKIAATAPENIHETDQTCLKLAAELLPRIPWDELDVLVIDRIGKNISGTGMDMNVVGLWRRTDEGPYTPMYKRIVVLDVSDESHGNCSGLGTADFTTRKLANKYDAEKTYMNMFTSNFIQGGKLPMVLETDVDAVEVALRSSKRVGTDFDFVRIKDTLSLGEFWVSAPLLEQLKGNPEYEVVRPLGQMPRDPQGNLLWA